MSNTYISISSQNEVDVGAESSGSVTLRVLLTRDTQVQFLHLKVGGSRFFFFNFLPCG